MKIGPTAITATLLAAVAAGGVLLTSVGTASAQDARDRVPGPVPGMAAMHEQMTAGNAGMARMHALHAAGTPGMARMHELMTNGPR